ncbi:uncharacterized protein [Leptinotarsa decemlineata]|uniref:uncharacterized protein n=1 Tax=Leptinotarsa decemlineata TaxID=7539 RepID=UPI003D30D56C
MRFYIVAAALLAVASAASKKEYAPPVAILKQIDKHNDDGSYSYGYEAADGTFKIETKYPDGEVYGKYGYIDDTGTLREVEYGASRRGFEPTGNEIQVAPPTLRNSQAAPARPLAPNEEDDGQYREDPAMYYKDDPYAQQQPQQREYQPTGSYQPSSRYQRPQSIYAEPEYEPEPYRPIYQPETTYRPAYRPQASHKPQPSFRPQSYYAPDPEPEPEYRPVYRPDPPRSYYQPQPQPQPAYRPQSNFGFSNDNNYHNPPSYNNNYSNPPSYNNYGGPSWQGHPATNVDINTGSYSVSYKR